MATLKIDNKEYDLDTLSDECKAQLASIQFVEKEIAGIQAQAAVLQTAKAAYLQTLKNSMSLVGGIGTILEQEKKRGLVEENVEVPKTQLVLAGNNLKSKKTEANKFSEAIELRETGRYQEAQDLLTKILEVEPTDAEGWSLLSQLFLLDKKDAEAEKALATAILINPNLPSIYRNQSRLLLKNSKPEEALLKAQSGYEISTYDTESWLVLAAGLIANQRDLEAHALIEKALKARPNYAEALANRALISLKAKNISGAIEDFEKAVALKPHLTQIWELLGTLRYQNKNLSGAIEALKKAQALEPDNVNHMVNLGEFLRQDQRIEEAIAILEEATEKSPENANAWINLGTALQQNNKIEDSQIAYKKALVINPNSAEVCNNLGSIAKDTKDWESARKYFEQAIIIKPDLAEAHSNLGTTLHELGRLAEAETSYKKAIVIKPDYAEAYYDLGLVLKELGRLEHAETSYAQAVRLKPNFIKARHAMLTCLYLTDKRSLFFDELDYLIKEDASNSVVGSLTCRAGLKYGFEKPNIFCNEPLKYVQLVDLKSRYNFEEIFALNVKYILSEKKRSNRKQPLLSNGYQTSGNLFDLESNLTDQIQKVIRSEIEKYRMNYESSQEGLIRKWPTAYSLYGWLISMKSGGELSPHIHENGWLSGSIYINVPPKTKIDSGKLVVALGKDSDTTNSRQNSKKVIDVVTGSMAIFPASLMHHTIPFESEEERIVLAFDVVPKSH